MTASFIPVFTSYMREKSKEEVWDFANRLFWTLSLVVAVITILGMVFSPAVVQLFSGENVARAEAVDLNRIIFPYLFFIALAALAMGILNCFHIFGLPAATPVLLNVATILFSVGDVVMELVLGGYAIAVATAILPMMSHQAATKDFESLKKTLSFSVRIVAFITIPAALGLMILREPIIRVLFQHGQFIAESTRLTARALL